MPARLSQINTKALSFDGSTEKLQTAAAVNLGVANAWTIFAAIWPRTPGAQNLVFLQQTTPSSVNLIRLQIGGSQDINFATGSSGGTLQTNGLSRTTETVYLPKAWNYLAVSWDGTTLRASFNGQTWTVTTPTPSMSMTNTDRFVTIAADQANANRLDGFVQDMALWSSALGQSALNALTADGGACLHDLRNDWGSYDGAATLVHYWRCGLASGSGQSGGDYVTDDATDGAGVDVTGGAASMSSADIVTASPFVYTGNCLDFNGTDEYLKTSATSSAGFSDTWTLSLIVKSDRDTHDETLLDIAPATGNVNRILVKKMGAQTGDYLNLLIYNSSGTLVRDYRWNAALPTGTWVNLLFTRAGGVANDPTELYVDGVLVAEDLLDTNVNGSMSSTLRRVTVAATRDAAEFFDGRIAGVAFWDVALDAAALAVIGADSSANLARANGYDYAIGTELSNLQHWFRLGDAKPTDWGAGSTYVVDFAGAATGMDLSAGAVNVSDADVVTNDPPT